MTRETESHVLRYLQTIDEKLDRAMDEVRDIKDLLASIEASLAQRPPRR